MSTRLSTEERERLEASALRNGLFGRGAARLAHEVEESWKERDAARRALRDLTAQNEKLTEALRQMIALGLWTEDEEATVDAARAVLSENQPKPNDDPNELHSGVRMNAGRARLCDGCGQEIEPDTEHTFCYPGAP